MAHRDDDKYTATGGTGHVSDSLYTFYGGPEAHINERRHRYNSVGGTGEQLNTREHSRLGVQGYLGALADRLAAWWGSL